MPACPRVWATGTQAPSLDWRDGSGTPLVSADPTHAPETEGRTPGACMDLYEYQGKQFFARYGIPVSPGEAVTTVDDAVAAAERIGYPVVVKAQVQVGGRGKAGGIKLANDADEVPHARRRTSSAWTSRATRSRSCGSSTPSDIAEEYYASFTLDRSAKKHLGMLSAQGGVEIEAVAEEDPDAIAKIWIDPVDGLDEDDGPGVGEGGQAQPGGRRRRRRHPAQALPRLHRGRRRPRRDQPADPHSRPARCTRSTPRSRLDGNSDVPPPRLRAVRRHAGARRARAGRPREGPAVRRARRVRRRHRQRRRPRHVAPSTSSTRSAASRPTSSTSAAAPTPT